MFPSWRQYSNDRQQRPVNFCERCGAVVDLDPDSTFDRKFQPIKGNTMCADEIIYTAAEELENG